ncbi:LAQU0S01e12442g1_1 [Lachancea quebecensis]|uniref:LAQU0S01e12442g1_1 n=1 Tax=Lachancea quebecensis TaxID=1654605 RepID=A0A0P1KPM8_9SACH|nr:LAQU0S01e12442g1_1 [Lachancea quebecensis]
MFSLGLNSGAFWARPLRAASRRMIATAKTSAARQQEILIAQRKNRPVSPHLTIYQPQLTWYLSSLHRVSGVILAFGFFATTIAFGTSALLGLGLTSSNLARWYHEKVPRWMDLTAKGSFAYLFAFHFANGLRHLIWDAGKALTLRGVYTTGYAVMAVMALGGSYLLTW